MKLYIGLNWVLRSLYEKRAETEPHQVLLIGELYSARSSLSSADPAGDGTDAINNEGRDISL